MESQNQYHGFQGDLGNSDDDDLMVSVANSTSHEPNDADFNRDEPVAINASTLIKTSANCTKCFTAPKAKKTKTDVGDEILVEMLNKIKTKSEKSTVDSDSEAFGLYIGETLKTIDVYQREMAKLQMQQVVFNIKSGQSSSSLAQFCQVQRPQQTSTQPFGSFNNHNDIRF